MNNYTIYGCCNFCGAEGKEIEDRGRKVIICLACYTEPTKESDRITHAKSSYKSHEEAMYRKALYSYYQNPKWLNKPCNERVVAIACDRYKSKEHGVSINEKLWGELPPDVQ